MHPKVIGKVQLAIHLQNSKVPSPLFDPGIGSRIDPDTLFIATPGRIRAPLIGQLCRRIIDLLLAADLLDPLQRLIE